MKFIASLILIFLGCFTGTALASDAMSNPATAEVLRQIFEAVVHGQWWVAAAASVVGVCAAVRHYMPTSWKEGVKGDIAGVALAFTMAFAGAIANWAVAPGAAMSLAVLATAAKVGAAAIGGFTVLHKVIGWLMAWDKLPAWLKPVLTIVATVIGSSAVKKAEDAGDAAVAAHPAPGMAPDKMREVE